MQRAGEYNYKVVRQFAVIVAIPAVGVVFTLGCACSALTCLLQRPPFEVNRCPLPADGRPDGCPKRTGGVC
jgi:hypothetical protein